MEGKDLRKPLTINLILILLIAWLFTVKGCQDNRKGLYYSKRLKEITSELIKRSSTTSRDDLEKDLDELDKNLERYYRFPKFFFFSFVILANALAIWSAALLSKLPPETRIQGRNGMRLVITLGVFLIVTLCFFLLKYHVIIRFGWVLLVQISEWILIGSAVAICLSDRAYDSIMGIHKDKDLIEGAPPPAW